MNDNQEFHKPGEQVPGTHILVKACEQLGFFLLDVSTPPQNGWNSWEEIDQCPRLRGDMIVGRQYMVLKRPGHSQSLGNAQTNQRMCIDITAKTGEKTTDWCNGYNARRYTRQIPFTRVIVSSIDINLLIPPTEEEHDPLTLSFLEEHVRKLVNRLSVCDLSQINMKDGIHCVGNAMPALWLGRIVPFYYPSS